MDWLMNLIFGADEKACKQSAAEDEKEKQDDMIADYQSEVIDGIFELRAILQDLCMACPYAIGQNEQDELIGLAPLFPIIEVISMQGYIGERQRDDLLRRYKLVAAGYSIDSLENIATGRAHEASQWRELSGLDEKFCGKIWRLLIELICRNRAPQLLQQVIDALGKILYNFYFLENDVKECAWVNYQHIISNLNYHAEQQQQTPYLHGAMLLQMLLAEKYGGTASDFEPCLDTEKNFSKDGREYLCFAVYSKAEKGWSRFYAVRKISRPSEPDLVWELPAGGGAEELFFEE